MVLVCARMPTLTWATVDEELAKDLFHIWISGADYEWAQDAWRRLTDAGLTAFDDDDELERHRVVIRFLTLAAIYHRFCDNSFREGTELDVLAGEIPTSDEPDPDGVSLNPFRIGQLVGDDSPAEDIGEALVELVRQEHRTLLRALTKTYQDPGFLFASLWRSATRGWSDEPEDSPDDAEILNEDISSEKLEAYQWFEEGCPLN